MTENFSRTPSSGLETRPLHDGPACASRWQHAHRDGLSKREQEVFDLLARGLTNKEIASALYITEGTAKAHLHHIYEKLGVRSRTEAVLLAADKDQT